MGILKFIKVTKDVENEDFNCGVDTINKYVKESYFPSLAQQCYTFKIIANDTVIGYYQLLFRDIKIELFPNEISDVMCGIKDNTISVVHVRFLAIGVKYHKNKLGTNVLRIIIKKVEELAENWPIRVITIDARNELVNWYEREGFKKLAYNPSGQEGVTSLMYFDCIKNNAELNDYINDMIDNYG